MKWEYLSHHLSCAHRVEMKLKTGEGGKREMLTYQWKLFRIRAFRCVF